MAKIDLDGKKVPRWLKFLVNMESLADGHFKAELNKDTGEERTYWVSPDRAANEHLLNRYLGKPTESMKMEGDLATSLELSDKQFEQIVNLAAKRLRGTKSGT